MGLTRQDLESALSTQTNKLTKNLEDVKKSITILERKNQSRIRKPTTCNRDTQKPERNQKCEETQERKKT